MKLPNPVNYRHALFLCSPLYSATFEGTAFNFKPESSLDQDARAIPFGTLPVSSWR